MNAERTIGLIGLGLVGRAIASRLMAAGFTVLGYDKSAQAMNLFEGKSTAEAKRAKRIVLAVFDTSDVEQIAAEATPELFIDCTTGDPVRVEALSRFRSRGDSACEDGLKETCAGDKPDRRACRAINVSHVE